MMQCFGMPSNSMPFSDVPERETPPATDTDVILRRTQSFEEDEP